jgi:hypothetical protein
VEDGPGGTPGPSRHPTAGKAGARSAMHNPICTADSHDSTSHVKYEQVGVGIDEHLALG